MRDQRDHAVHDFKIEQNLQVLSAFATEFRQSCRRGQQNRFLLALQQLYRRSGILHFQTERIKLILRLLFPVYSRLPLRHVLLRVIFA